MTEDFFSGSYQSVRHIDTRVEKGGILMPIYEYKCNICGQFFEKLIFSSGDEEKNPCPKCGDNEVRRVMSATGILGSSCAKASTGFS